MTLLIALAAGRGEAGAKAKQQATEDGWPGRAPRITIRLLNEARVPARALADMRQTVDGIFHKAGVGITWSECPLDPKGQAHGSCASALTLDQFEVRLTSRCRAKLGVLGHAVGQKASVCYENVVVMSDWRYTGIMLGCALAHELGHLLLATEKHSLDGLMAGPWDGHIFRLAEQASLSFASKEARRVRRAAEVRMAAAGVAREHAQTAKQPKP